MLDGLVHADLAAEYHALVGVGHGLFQCPASHADDFGGVEDTFRVEAVEDITEAAAFFADPAIHRHDEVVIEGLVRVDSVAAHLRDFTNLDRVTVEVGVEQRQTVGRLHAILDRAWCVPAAPPCRPAGPCWSISSGR